MSFFDDLCSGRSIGCHLLHDHSVTSTSWLAWVTSVFLNLVRTSAFWFDKSLGLVRIGGQIEQLVCPFFHRGSVMNQLPPTILDGQAARITPVEWSLLQVGARCQRVPHIAALGRR